MPSDRERKDLDLPEVLMLPLASGRPYWYWLGARPAVDLVNTLRERWRRRVETLATPGDLSIWLVEAEVVVQPVTVSRTVLAEARDLREAIDVALVAAVARTRPPKTAVAAIDDWLVHAGPRPQLRLGADGIPQLGERAAADSARRALGAIALDAATMLGDPAQRGRLRICEADDCSARFYDRSPAGKRRWCSMQTCGNAAKARRHRERLRSTGAAA
jgi:predicted RNA-binding Zn ribbon-like protein